MRTLPTVLLIALTAPGAVSSTELRVGPVGQSGCDHSTIQAAVNAVGANGSGTLRVNAGTYDEAVAVENRSITLIGGYASCTSPSPGTWSVIDAGGSTATGPTALRFSVSAASTSTARFLNIENFDITGGVSAGSHGEPGLTDGGGLRVHTTGGRTADVLLDNTWVYGNVSRTRGGGVALSGTGNGFLSMRNDSRIHDNLNIGEPPFGGGLYCQGNYGILISGGSIHNNRARTFAIDFGGGGGGVALLGCQLNWHADAPGNGPGTLRDNRVEFGGSGGGLFAAGGAQVLLTGSHLDSFFTSTRPLRIHDNRIEHENTFIVSRGGAIFAFGAGTTVTVDRSWIYRNHSVDTGGAVFAGFGATINIDRLRPECHNDRHCSRVFENSSVAEGAAGTVRDPESRLDIRRTVLADNTVTEGPGSVLFNESAGAMLRLRDTLLHGDAGAADFAIRLVGGSGIFNGSTLADTGRQVFHLADAALNLTGSIIHEAGDHAMVNSEGTPAVEADCVIWHHAGLAGIPGASIGRVQTADPLFADRENDLYYLSPGSPAINFCDNFTSPPGVDLEWNPRGISHSGQPDVYGPHDLGAYEFPLGIFSDRFETSP